MGQEPQVGLDPEEVDEQTPNPQSVDELLGVTSSSDDDQDDGGRPDRSELVGMLEGRDDVDPIVEMLVDELVRLRDRVDELEDDQEDTHDVATTAVAKAQSNEGRVDDLEDEEEKTRDIARSAIAKAEQVDADPDQQEDAEQLPQGVEPSTSPLDFFANCRQTKIKEMFVENSNRQNTYRAVKVAKRWKEFGREGQAGNILFSRDDVAEALTAILNGKPHRETIARVWNTLRDDLGGDDVDEITHTKSANEVECLRIRREAAERLLEKRYVGLDLLDGSEDKATTGGVTPVVTEGAA